ncbi:hypothetical protein CBX57_008765 [Salmonella enterica]|nr:hypothetical protein [Salmonella enterica]
MKRFKEMFFIGLFTLIAAGFSVSVMADAQPPEQIPAAHIHKGVHWCTLFGPDEEEPPLPFGWEWPWCT